MTGTQFLRGWKYFCDCIDFNHSNLDAEAIRFMNEMPTTAAAALARYAIDGTLRRCRVCGCTDEHACPGGCSWIENDLCSACASSTENKHYKGALNGPTTKYH